MNLKITQSHACARIQSVPLPFSIQGTAVVVGENKRKGGHGCQKLTG